MNPTVTKSKAGWRWEIGDGRFVGVCPTKEEAEAEALRWSIVLYAEGAEQRAAAAEAEVARLRAAWADAVAEVAAMGTEPDLGGLALTPRRSPATMKALREVARMLAEAQPAEVADV